MSTPTNFTSPHTPTSAQQPPTAAQVQALYAMFPASYRADLFSRYRSTYEQAWNSRRDFRSQLPSRAGSMGDFFKRVSPLSIDDFADAYVSEKLHHLTYCAEALMTMGLPTGPHTPAAAAHLLAAHMLSDRTFIGFTKESRLLTFLNSHFPDGFFTARYLTGEEDRLLGADILLASIFEQEECFIQVKPISFFRGGANNPLLQQDRRALFTKVRATEQHTNTPVKWFIAPKDGVVPIPSKGNPILLTTDEAYNLIPAHLR